MPSRTDRAISLIQLAIRKGSGARGDQLLKAITSKKAYLAIYSDQMGANRKKKLLDKCSSFQIPSKEISAERMNMVSDRATSAVAILDKGFAEAIGKALEDSETKQ